MDKLVSILEELKDINPVVKNVHYTDLFGLYGILNNGILKGQDYWYKASDKKNSDFEIASIRNTSQYKYDNASDEVKKELSSSVSFIKINLFTDRIKSGVRGASVKPIAEIPKRYLEIDKKERRAIEDSIDWFLVSKQIILPADMTKKMFIDGAMEILRKKDLFPDFKYFRDDIFDVGIKAFSIIAKQLRKDGSIKVNLRKDGNTKELLLKILDYNRESANNFNHIRNRETEERIVVNNKRTGIPVNSKFMNIKILNFTDEKFKKDVKYLNREWDDDNLDRKKGIGEFIQLIEEYARENVIVKDENYYRLISMLNKEKKRD